MSEQRYAAEADLQNLLASHPGLLSADGEPHAWVLVSREFGIASEQDGSDRWSVDHLFLDEAAVPTLVEVKRSTDTRIRREVVGQMLDDLARRQQLQARLNEISGITIADDQIDKYPSFPIAALVDGKAFDEFTAAMDWVIDEASRPTP
jgi:hypothetical protein